MTRPPLLLSLTFCCLSEFDIGSLLRGDEGNYSGYTNDDQPIERATTEPFEPTGLYDETTEEPFEPTAPDNSLDDAPPSEFAHYASIIDFGQSSPSLGPLYNSIQPNYVQQNNKGSQNNHSSSSEHNGAESSAVKVVYNMDIDGMPEPTEPCKSTRPIPVQGPRHGSINLHTPPSAAAEVAKGVHFTSPNPNSELVTQTRQKPCSVISTVVEVAAIAPVPARFPPSTANHHESEPTSRGQRNINTDGSNSTILSSGSNVRSTSPTLKEKTSDLKTTEVVAESSSAASSVQRSAESGKSTNGDPQPTGRPKSFKPSKPKPKGKGKGKGQKGKAKAKAKAQGKGKSQEPELWDDADSDADSTEPELSDETERIMVDVFWDSLNPRSPGVRPSIFPDLDELFSPTSETPMETIYQSAAEAEADQKTTQEVKKAIVVAMTNLMMSVKFAQDNKSHFEQWIKADWERPQIEAVAWRVLEGIIDRCTTGPALRYHEYRRFNQVPRLMSCRDRISKLFEGLMYHKTMVKHLLDPSYLDVIIEDPYGAVSRIRNNKNVNANKKEKLAAYNKMKEAEERAAREAALQTVFEERDILEAVQKAHAADQESAGEEIGHGNHPDGYYADDEMTADETDAVVGATNPGGAGNFQPPLETFGSDMFNMHASTYGGMNFETGEPLIGAPSYVDGINANPLPASSMVGDSNSSHTLESHSFTLADYPADTGDLFQVKPTQFPGETGTSTAMRAPGSMTQDFPAQQNLNLSVPMSPATVMSQPFTNRSSVSPHQIFLQNGGVSYQNGTINPTHFTPQDNSGDPNVNWLPSDTFDTSSVGLPASIELESYACHKAGLTTNAPADRPSAHQPRRWPTATTAQATLLSHSAPPTSAVDYPSPCNIDPTLRDPLSYAFVSTYAQSLPMPASILPSSAGVSQAVIKSQRKRKATDAPDGGSYHRTKRQH
ncbi:uncharacterized protein BP01DRAFT_405305 [Aspergillus saccharolyticus JOP 1030-1]|uniref:Uncharacterized protein n=1 Tax=Aspergillus saccharolyticus JOP 1030-1 TaxID=1450539 RepID=A0A318ZFC5_9EURO|nr:hypothetical protein BP01DRAFT_405305 [Aspergillus saccharolyticus JOP 1030-1]PYH42310.1 hypothetical protein BP01DRAFT_405305 [Aspergillus saccharolyticus JOP 1030-1]